MDLLDNHDSDDDIARVKLHPELVFVANTPQHDPIMALPHFRAYLNRSTKYLADVLRMDGASQPNRAPITLLKLHTHEDIKEIATGFDADIGGTSTLNFALDDSVERNKGSGSPATARFWGDMRLAVRPEFQGRIRGGYAGFRTKTRPSLFGEICDDLSNHQYLALRLRLGGDPRTRNSYYVNLQTDGPVTTDLWQHRLYFKRNDGGWEDIFIPLDNFILTNTGELVQHQMTMFRQRIRTVGISMLGGNSGVSGSYDLGIHSIRAVNEENVSRPPLVEKDPESI